MPTACASCGFDFKDAGHLAKLDDGSEVCAVCAALAPVGRLEVMLAWMANYVAGEARRAARRNR